MPFLRLSAFIDDKVATGLDRLREASGLAKEQAKDLQQMHNKISEIREVTGRVGEFANILKNVEKEVDEAIAKSSQIIGANIGVGALSRALAEIKANAVNLQSDIGLAKNTVDKLVPTRSELDCCNLALAMCAPGRSQTNPKQHCGQVCNIRHAGLSFL